MSAIKTITTTVYIGHKRRRLTKAAAYNDAAYKLMLDGCDHERSRLGYDEDGAPYGEDCFYCAGHVSRNLAQIEQWHRLHKRLARWLKWRDERSVT